MKKFIIVETTCPDKKSAEKLAKFLLQQKLAACVHFLPISSHYVWQKKLTKSREILLRIKTAKPLFSKVEKAIIANHPYEVPQIISVEISDVAKPYLAWLEATISKVV